MLAAYTGLLTGLALVRGVLRRHAGAPWTSRRTLLSGLRRMLALNGNIMLRTLCLIFAFAFFTRQGARQGDVVLAGNALLMNFQMLTALGLDGFANAAEALVGRAIGANDRRRFVLTVRLTALWSAAIAIGYSATYAVFGTGIINLLTTIEVLRDGAANYLVWVVVAPIISVWCFLLDGIFIGATRGPEMRDSMMLSTFAVFIPCWFVLTPLGNHGLWLAVMVFFAARGASMGWLFFRIDRADGFVAGQ